MDWRNEILEMQDIGSEPVTVPEWGGKTFLVTGLSGEERRKLYAESMKGDELDMDIYPFTLLVLAVKDATGQPVFRMEDREKLRKKNGMAIQRLSVVAMRLSGLGPDDMEEAEKNSDSVTPKE
ncbi:MAG: hypothetical protein PHC52_13430 [Syntrophales bacterium]|nr:hypothetical protein [Syntrophales bacterium]